MSRRKSEGKIEDKQEEEEEELPEGWYKTVDNNSGRPFYYTADGRRQWHFPGNSDRESINSDRDLEPLKKKKENVDSSGYEKNITAFILKFFFFPFQSIGKAVIWFIVQLFFCVFELVVGFMCLPGQSEASFAQCIIKETCDQFSSFLPIFLIVDGFLWLIEMVLHYVLLASAGNGPAAHLLQNPPAFDTPFFGLFATASSRDKYRFWINFWMFAAFRVVQLVLTVVAAIKLMLTTLAPKMEYMLDKLLEPDKIRAYIGLENLLRGAALAFVDVNLLALTLWAVFFGIVLYLRVEGKKLLSEKKTVTS